MSDKRHAHRNALPRQLCAAICLLSILAQWPALAEVTSSGGGAHAALSASARLDFNLNIGKFVFFRVGSSAFPTASGTVDTVSFNAVPTIPAGAVVPLVGDATSVIWDGTLPTLTATPTSLPVEVRSNAGQISIFASATTPLTSGADSIPLSEIILTSSDATLPAPLVPNAGTGAAVNVTGTAFSNLVTVRNANWTFSYNPLVTQRAGVYTGQVSFTASSP